MAARGVDIFPQWVGSLLSIGRLCDHGLSALYTASTVTISDGDGTVILSGHRCPRTSLWLIDISGAPPTLPSTHKTAEPPTANAVITEAKGTQERVVAYYHACMGAPALSTFTKAIDKLGLALPGLTSDMVRRFPPTTTATPKGHMDQFPQGKRSTKPGEPTPVVSESGDETDTDLHPPVIPRTSRTLPCFSQLFPASDLRAHDLTGRFTVKGTTGAQYLMIMICGNYIHIETVKDRGQTDYVKAYAHGADFFEARGITPSFERMDNEDSDLLVQYCKAHTTHRPAARACEQPPW